MAKLEIPIKFKKPQSKRKECQYKYKIKKAYKTQINNGIGLRLKR